MNKIGLNLKLLALSICVIISSLYCKCEETLSANEISQLMEKANNGDAESQCKLGQLYEQGNSFDQNYAEAVKWYKKAADQNHPYALYSLGLMYNSGQGVPKDEFEAEKLLISSAKLGYNEAQIALSLKYWMQGFMDAQNFVQAFDWAKMAADQGSDIGMAMVGSYYQYGQGVDEDYAEAVKWYKKAAAQGNETAKKFLNQSEIDFDIPSSISGISNTTFAIIIGNEDYNKVSKVPYAEQDSKIFKEYLNYAVGVPKDNIKSYTNAGYGDIAGALKYVENLSEAFGDELNLIFYYAGHGVPNERTSQAMLLPVDGDATIPETCFDLDQIYSKLGSLKANSVLVILDACFSGTERGDNMLASARGVKIKAKQAEPTGNLIVLSASQGDETAYPLEKEKHGMFTYFLLKKLQENKGDVTLGELTDYVITKVKQQSIVTNGKIQTPSIIVSPSMQDIWRKMKFGK